MREFSKYAHSVDRASTSLHPDILDSTSWAFNAAAHEAAADSDSSPWFGTIFMGPLIGTAIGGAIGGMANDSLGEDEARHAGEGTNDGTDLTDSNAIREPEVSWSDLDSGGNDQAASSSDASSDFVSADTLVFVSDAEFHGEWALV